MTEELIASIIGFILSWLIESIPGFNDWWSGLSYKRWILFAFYVLVVPGAVWLLVCQAGIDLGIAIDCTIMGLVGAIFVGWSAFIGNQAGWVVLGQRTQNARARA